jgi:hypothetical protein
MSHPYRNRGRIRTTLRKVLPHAIVMRLVPITAKEYCTVMEEFCAEHPEAIDFFNRKGWPHESDEEIVARRGY